MYTYRIMCNSIYIYTYVHFAGEDWKLPNSAVTGRSGFATPKHGHSDCMPLTRTPFQACQIMVTILQWKWSCNGSDPAILAMGADVNCWGGNWHNGSILRPVAGLLCKSRCGYGWSPQQKYGQLNEISWLLDPAVQLPKRHIFGISWDDSPRMVATVDGLLEKTFHQKAWFLPPINRYPLVH